MSRFAASCTPKCLKLLFLLNGSRHHSKVILFDNPWADSDPKFYPEKRTKALGQAFRSEGV